MNHLPRRALALWALIAVSLVVLPLGAVAAVRTINRAAPPGADLILFNGQVSTLDADNNTVEAIAIDDGEVIAVGNNGFVQRLGGSNTTRVNLKGRRVLPGLIDGHLHGLRNGYHCFTQTVRLDLITSRDDALAAYEAKADELSDDRWIWTTFGGWNVGQLDPPGMFTIEELDAAVPDNPVWVTATGFNGPRVNSRALEVLELTADSPGVEVDPDTGEPTGRLTAPATEVANEAILEQLNARSIEEQAGCLADFVREANSRGLTAWKDPDGNQFPWGPGSQEFSQDLHGHQPALHLHRNGDLNARVAFHQMPNFGGLPQVLEDTRNAMGFIGDDMLRYMGIGEEFFPDEYVDYHELTQHAAANRLSLEHHATASETIDDNLAGFEAANEVHPIAELVWSIAHPGDGLPTDEQLDRGAELGIGWTPSISSVRNGAPGPRFRSIMENSAHMCLITDAMNVAPWAPFQKLWYVTSGDTLLPNTTGVPEDQRLTREEALRHSTVECAWNLDQEDRLGSLEVGKNGDLVVLTDDYFTVPSDDIRDIRSVLTVVDGRIVFADGDYAGLDG